MVNLVTEVTAAPQAPKAAVSPARVTDLALEYRTEVLGMDEPKPRFQWRMLDDRSGARQSAWQLEVRDATETVWDSGVVRSDASVQLEYAGSALRPHTRYFWRVRIADGAGLWAPWSEEQWFETGWMRGDWAKCWLTPPHGAEPMAPARYLRRAFQMDRATTTVVRARLHTAAFGLYMPYLNGEAVTSDCLLPGWSDYFHRVLYRTFDVTALLRPGENVLGTVLVEGWYAGRIARHYSQEQPTYGERPSFTAWLQLDYADGTSQAVAADGAWRYSDAGPLRMSDIYMGEDYDARMEMPGWNAPGFDDSGWLPLEVAHREIHCAWSAGMPVRRMACLRPELFTAAPDGAWIVDLGQNLAGRERLYFHGLRRGQSIRVRHGEMLYGDGALYTGNLRTARAETVYIASGEAEEEFEPEFVWYGFRYLEISGLASREQLAGLEVYVLHSAIEPSGDFECSDPLVNRLFANTWWSQKSNFIDIPTDCPQRDERYGWTGDAQVFCNAASYNMDTAAFFTKWLEDLKLCRNRGGAYPHYAPYYMPKDPEKVEWDTIIGAPGWADAGIVCPWQLYRHYGDKRILERHYPAMVQWIEYQKLSAKDLIRDSLRYGDWLNLHADLPSEFVATAFFAWGTQLVARIAEVLGYEEDRRYFDDLAARIRRAFNEKFVSYGYLIFRTQSACAMLLEMELVPEEYRADIARTLVEDIVTLRHGHLSTGFLGTPFLCHALAANGYADVAYRLLRQTGYPGWLYPVTQGATTIWERLNSYTCESGFASETMNSFNHYSYGVVVDWLYEGVAGIRRPKSAALPGGGFQHFELAPLPGGGLRWAKGYYRTSYGRIESAWERGDGLVRWRCRIPANCSARVIFPVTEPAAVSGSVPVTGAVMELEAGHYEFQWPESALREDLLRSC